MKTWAKGFDAAPVAGGKTKGTYDKIGTITIPNKEIAVYLYGFLVALGLQIATAGEGLTIEIELNSSDLGLYQERFWLPYGTNDAIATNNKAIHANPAFVPVLVGQKANNKKIDVHASVGATTTGNLNGYVSAIFGDVPPENLPPDYLDEIMKDFKSAVRSLGRTASDAAKAHGTAAADVPLTAIAIPSKGTELVALLGALTENAETASEEAIAQFTFESGSISDFAPQEYPSSIFTSSPSLGTPVGAPAYLAPVYYPVRFPLPATNFDMSVKSRSVLALTNAPNCIQGAKFRV